MDKDPLSLLADDSSSSDSECESDPLNGKKALSDKSYYSSSDTGITNRLPSPSTLFSTVKEPDFLKTHLSDHNVDWDNLVKGIENQQEQADNSNGRTFAAIPPPPSHDEEVDPRAEISSDPVKYAVSDMRIDPKLLTVSSDTSAGNDVVCPTTGDKRPNDDKDNSKVSNTAKKSKGESFKEKEKRKRDLGMSSRGKSFVEEEKRILREKFD